MFYLPSYLFMLRLEADRRHRYSLLVARRRSYVVKCFMVNHTKLKWNRLKH